MGNSWGVNHVPVAVDAFGNHFAVTASDNQSYVYGLNSLKDGIQNQMASDHNSQYIEKEAPAAIRKAADFSAGSDVYYYNTDVTKNEMDQVLGVALGGQHTLIQRVDGTMYAAGGNTYGQLGSYVRNAYGAGNNDVEGKDPVRNDNPANRYYPYRVGADDFYSIYLVGADTMVLDGVANAYTSLPAEGEQAYVTMTENQILRVELGKATLKYVPGFRLFHEDDVTANATEYHSTNAIGLKNNSFWAEVSNKNIADVAVSGTTLTVTPKRYGEANVLVKMEGNADTNMVGEYAMIHVTVIQDQPTATDGRTVKVAAPQIAAGQNFTVSLKSDGTVWTWGSNASGQLGLGDTADRSAPTQVFVGYQCSVCGKSTLSAADGDKCTLTGSCTGIMEGSYLSNIIAVSAGVDFAIALDRDGQVWTWGSNANNKLGRKVTGNDNRVPRRILVTEGTAAVPPTDPGDPSTGTPAVPAKYVSDAIAIAAGDQFGLALAKDGTVWSWGLNSSRELGDVYDGSASSAKPTKVNAGVTAAGESQSGKLYATRGYLRDVIAIYAGANHAVALRENGMVVVWGGNASVKHQGGSEDVTITYAYPNYTMAGETYADQITLPTNYRRGLKEVVDLSAGSNVTVYETAAHKALLSGSRFNRYGLDEIIEIRPVYLRDLDGAIVENVQDVAVGNRHGALVTGTVDGKDTAVWTWGLNTDGQQGLDYYTGQNSSAFVADATHDLAHMLDSNRSTNNTPVYLQNVIAVGADTGHSVLYKEDGSVFSVGSNANGQMGTGDFRDPRFVLPVQSGDQENRSVKPSWLNVVKMDGSNMEYGGTTGRLVPDYFTLYIDGTNSDRLEIDRAKMLECYSAGFNLYTDTEVNSISNWAAVTMTVASDSSIPTAASIPCPILMRRRAR